MNNKNQSKNSREAKSEALALAFADTLEGGIISVEEMVAVIQLFLYQENFKKDNEKLK